MRIYYVICSESEYGTSRGTLAYPRDEAQRIADKANEQLPGIRHWIEQDDSAITIHDLNLTSPRR